MTRDLSLLPDRIRTRIIVAPGCWLWTGCVGKKDGYGRVQIEGSPKVVHRVVYEMLIGPIPEGLVLDHVATRGCKHRHCVNVFEHLEPVTRGTNTRRGGNTVKTHCVSGHEFTEENTRWVAGRRKCRICIRAYNYERRYGKPHPTGGLTPLRITSLSSIPLVR